MILNLTVVRFPNGSWSYGGRPDARDYEGCEVFVIASAKDAQSAIKKAQHQRRMKLAKAQYYDKCM